MYDLLSVEVDKAIGRSKSDRRVMTTMDQGGRPAVSLIRALATDVQREMLLVEVRPRTGGGFVSPRSARTGS